MKTRLPRLLFVAAVLILSAFPATRLAATTCEERVYADCMTFCSGVAQEGRCDFYASQACLCMRFPADCPVCY
jgi:hypothetical protein